MTQEFDPYLNIKEPDLNKKCYRCQHIFGHHIHDTIVSDTDTGSHHCQFPNCLCKGFRGDPFNVH